MFDFAAYKRAFEAKDVPAWAEFYADEAEWIEYADRKPPRQPNVMSGKPAIVEFLQGVAASQVTLELRDEVIGDGRAAFMVVCTFADGSRVLENAIVELAGGQIVRHVEVEAWD